MNSAWKPRFPSSVFRSTDPRSLPSGVRSYFSSRTSFVFQKGGSPRVLSTKWNRAIRCINRSDIFICSSCRFSSSRIHRLSRPMAFCKIFRQRSLATEYPPSTFELTRTVNVPWGGVRAYLGSVLWSGKGSDESGAPRRSAAFINLRMRSGPRLLL